MISILPLYSLQNWHPITIRSGDTEIEEISRSPTSMLSLYTSLMLETTLVETKVYST